MYGLSQSVHSAVRARRAKVAMMRQGAGAISNSTGAARPERAADLSRTARVRRAPDAFEHAFLKLVLERDATGVTATDVIEASGYSRGSFYRYYADLYDLLERLMSSEVEAYVRLVSRAVEQGLDLEREFDRVLCVARDLLAYVEDHQLFYRALFSSDVSCIGFEEFCGRAIACFRASGYVVVCEGAGEVDEDFYYYCTTRSFLIYIKYWVERGCGTPREQLARQIASMSAPDSAGMRPRFQR